MKIKRVLLFHGNEICNNTLNVFADKLAASLEHRNIDVGFVDLNAEGSELAEEYIREMNKGFDVAIAFNSCGQHETTMDGINVFEYMHVPFCNWILDHPCEHAEDILSNVKNYHVICLDRDHVNFVRRYFPNIAGAHFLPLGASGQNFDPSFEAFSNRKYDIVFTGSIFSLGELGNMIAGLPSTGKQVAVDMIEYMVDNRSCTNEEALRYALINNQIYAGREELREYSFLTRKTNPYVRTYVREEIMQFLARSGLKIDIFGTGWESMDNKGNLILHGAISYEDSVRLCAESKICLNIMPLFKDGLHDRIPTAMLGGAAVMTDSSRYIEESFTSAGDKSELLLFDISHPELIAEQISESLKDLNKLYNVAQNGFKKAQFMTWDKRVDELIGLIENF